MNYSTTWPFHKTRKAWYTSTPYRLAIKITALTTLTIHSTLACPPGTAISIQNTNLNVTTPTPFDPFSATGIRQQLTLKVENHAAVDCAEVNLTFTDAVTPNQLQSNTDTLTFAITQPGATRSLINQPTGIVIDTVPAGAEVAVKFDLVIPAATTATSPGDYVNNNIKLSLASAEAGQLDATKSLVIRTRVATLLNINIGGAAYIPGSLAPYTLDFGTLQTGATQAVNVTTRANVQHSLHLVSEHGGVLTGPLPSDLYHVAYTATLDGVVLNLENAVGGTKIPLGEKTALGGTTRVLKATIAKVGTAAAGYYRDVITLTVESDW